MNGDYLIGIILEFTNSLRVVHNGTDAKDSRFTKINSLHRKLYENNGCRFNSEKVFEHKYVCGSDGPIIHFIGSNAMGNDANSFYEAFILDDRLHFTVFMEYISKDLRTEQVEAVDENGITIITDNSLAFAVIKRIFTLIMEILYGQIVLSENFNKTIIGTNYRMTPTLIAAVVCNTFKPLTEDDVEGCGIDFNTILQILSSPETLQNKIMGARFE